MSEYTNEERLRSRTLLVVEGKHEKDELFRLVFRCFPEINIDMDDVWVYGTNIYALYKDIESEYGEGWTEEDIDLPFVISKKQGKTPLCYKNDFVNIILIFDYERHDINFSETKILEIQNCFMDAADMGKLYINYPMIESYQHLCGLPDGGFIDRKIPVSLQPGKKYKELVRNETIIEDWVNFPSKIEKFLLGSLGDEREQERKRCCEALLAISEKDEIKENIGKIVKNVLDGKEKQAAECYFTEVISRIGYVQSGKTYWEFMRNVFQQIIIHNISKAYRIQWNQEQIEKNRDRVYFEKLDLMEILKIQNEVSRDLAEGFIWVLNTCVFFVGEYNFSLVLK